MDAEQSFNANGLAWAVSCWQAEVKNRPLVNVHRRTLDDTWRQVIRYFGGDPDKLVGPSHDVQLMQQQEARAWKPPTKLACTGNPCVCGRHGIAPTPGVSLLDAENQKTKPRVGDE